MKDNFSAQSVGYARYRPVYPDELLQHILAQVPELRTAWDAGTGNGQVAVWLAQHFSQVYATDISEKQLAQAPQRKNIHYQLGAAEQTGFSEKSIDLITVAQAFHWFEHERFFQLAQRSLKSGGVIALFGYDFLIISPEVNKVLTYLYQHMLGDYWDDERRQVEQHYQNLPFPFQELTTPEFYHRTTWTIDHLSGYLNTWSAVQHYRNEHDTNPIALIEPELKAAWGRAKTREVTFPMFMRLGRNLNE
ncbi:MAG: class I SAM-dependent methyltransferase [Bacteroidota bacterium]